MNSKLLVDINQMESNISKLLKHIKICDSLVQNEVEDTLNAAYYSQLLNYLLNNLTSNFNEIDENLFNL